MAFTIRPQNYERVIDLDSNGTVLAFRLACCKSVHFNNKYGRMTKEEAIQSPVVQKIHREYSSEVTDIQRNLQVAFGSRKMQQELILPSVCSVFWSHKER
jgi:hypothetical protein